MAILVKCATTNSLVSLFGTPTIDGVPTSAGPPADLVLVKDQIAPATNGVYAVASGAAWSRDLSMDTWAEVPGALVTVQLGTVNASSVWLCTSQPGGTLEITPIAFANLPNIVTPEQFGAKGDGIVDDWQWLDAMCRSFEAAGGGIALFRGRYLISQTLVLPSVPFSFRGVALGSDVKGPGSIFATDSFGDGTPLLRFLNDPDNTDTDGAQFEILDINLGYHNAAMDGCALDIRYAQAGRIRVSMNNCYNGLYAGVCRGCEIELHASTFSDHTGDDKYGYALFFDASVIDAMHDKGTNIYVPYLFVNNGGNAGDSDGGDEPPIGPPLARFVGLDMYGASTFLLGDCRLSSCEVGWRTRMPEVDLGVDADGTIKDPKGSLTVGGILLSMSSEGCSRPLDLGGFNRIDIWRFQSNDAYGPSLIGDDRSPRLNKIGSGLHC